MLHPYILKPQTVAAGIGEVLFNAQVALGGLQAGAAEGLIRIILDPHSAQLLPGEIMVCSDPAWTPLFPAAAGLVMELGG